MAKVCHCYYRDHMTMAEIGQALGISRHRVGRLLKEAVEAGVVRIEIRTPFNASTELERALEASFGLRSSMVVETEPGLAPEEAKRQTCRAGAQFLVDMFDERSTIGIGWGSWSPRWSRESFPKLGWYRSPAATSHPPAASTATR